MSIYRYMHTFICWKLSMKLMCEQSGANTCYIAAYKRKIYKLRTRIHMQSYLFVQMHVYVYVVKAHKALTAIIVNLANAA